MSVDEKGDTDTSDLPRVTASISVAPAPVASAAPSAPSPLWRRGWVLDLGAVASFVAVAFWVTWRIWFHPGWGLAANRGDQAFFEWMMAHGARVVTEGANPFFSGQMNVPDGVNMMANTSALAVSIPLSPVTLLFGPHVAFNVFLTGALILTAVSWYFVFDRYLLHDRLAAWVGAGFCAFAPGMISQANGHPNIVSQFLVPILIWRTLEAQRSGRWLRNGVLLGLVVVWQAFINLEVLFMAAVGIGLFTAVVAIARPRVVRASWRPFVLSLATAAVLAGLLLAYPIAFQLSGPQSYSGLPVAVRSFGADLTSYAAFSTESLVGDPEKARTLAQNASEENSFFGWPLLVLVLAIVVWLRRNAVVVAVFLVGLVFVAFSLGPEVRFNGELTGVPSIWKVFSDVPVLSSAVPTRWAFAVTPIVGVLLALAVAEVNRRAAARPAGRRTLVYRYGALALVAVALLPIAPTALPATKLANTPAFVSEGIWREYAAGDRSILFVPTPTSAISDPIRWSAATLNEMPLARGYFLGPTSPDGVAGFTADLRATNYFLREVQRDRAVPEVSAATRANAFTDLAYWRAGAVVIPPRWDTDLYKEAMTKLLGFEPQRVGGVWLWDVRG